MDAPVVAGTGGARSPSSAFEVREEADGHFEIRGELTFATARRARDEGLRVFAAAAANVHDIDVDCSGITASDSAGLTVLLDWLSCARKHNRVLKLTNLPTPILAVARISNVEDLLTASESAPTTSDSTTVAV